MRIQRSNWSVEWFWKQLDNHVFQALYTKLFMVLGILWVCESFHSIIHDGGKDCKWGSSIEIFFTVIDCFNSLRGLFMFLIFICKESVWIQMKRYHASKRQDRRHDQGNKNRWDWNCRHRFKYNFTVLVEHPVYTFLV